MAIIQTLKYFPLLASVASDRSMHIWEVSPRGGISTISTLRAGDELFACDWNPSGTCLALAGREGTVEIIDAETATSQCSYTGHTRPICPWPGHLMGPVSLRADVTRPFTSGTRPPEPCCAHLMDIAISSLPWPSHQTAGIWPQVPGMAQPRSGAWQMASIWSPCMPRLKTRSSLSAGRPMAGLWRLQAQRYDSTSGTMQQLRAI